MTKIIIAGTFEQFIRCCHQKNLNPKYVPYITSPTQVEQISGSVEPIYFGTFWENPNLKEIERVMKSKGIRVKDQYVDRFNELEEKR